MTCHSVPPPSGGAAIICGPLRKCRCGKRATLLCDWKVKGKKSGTCDQPLCSGCAFKPSADKDLCSAHAGDFDRWQRARLIERGVA